MHVTDTMVITYARKGYHSTGYFYKVPSYGQVIEEIIPKGAEVGMVSATRLKLFLRNLHSVNDLGCQYRKDIGDFKIVSECSEV